MIEARSSSRLFLDFVAQRRNGNKICFCRLGDGSLLESLGFSMVIPEDVGDRTRLTPHYNNLITLGLLKVPTAEDWDEMILEDPSNPNHSEIPG